MLLIKTYLAESDINGTGLFASEDIKEGTLIWKEDSLDEVIDIVDNFEEYYEPREIDFINKYCFANDDILILCCDGAKYINHSTNPNMSKDCAAIKDIKKGEELTCDYRHMGITRKDLKFNMQGIE